MSLLKLRPETLNAFFSTFRAPFIGLSNYIWVLTGSGQYIQEDLRNSIFKTLTCVILVNLISLIYGLTVALALNRLVRFNGVSRTLLLLPFILPGFVVQTAWTTFFHKNDGLINKVLIDWLHLFPDRIDWFSGDLSLWVVIFTIVWHYAPLFIIFLLAGIQNIPKDCYEAADIDGAGHFKKLIYITVPLLRPVIAVLIFICTIFNVYYSHQVGGLAFYSTTVGFLLQNICTRSISRPGMSDTV